MRKTLKLAEMSFSVKRTLTQALMHALLNIRERKVPDITDSFWTQVIHVAEVILQYDCAVCHLSVSTLRA